MADYFMGISIGGPGQTSTIAIVTRGQEEGPRDQITLLPRVIKTIAVREVKRFQAGLKDSEIAEKVNDYLRQDPFTKLIIEHPGGAPALTAMKTKLRQGANVQWVKATSEDNGREGVIERVRVHDMIFHLSPAVQEKVLRIPETLDLGAELRTQVENLMQKQEWRAGGDDLASALLLAAYFSRPEIQGGLRPEFIC